MGNVEGKLGAVGAVFEGVGVGVIEEGEVGSEGESEMSVTISKGGVDSGEDGIPSRASKPSNSGAGESASLV